MASPWKQQTQISSCWIECVSGRFIARTPASPRAPVGKSPGSIQIAPAQHARVAATRNPCRPVRECRRGACGHTRDLDANAVVNVLNRGSAAAKRGIASVSDTAPQRPSVSRGIAHRRVAAQRSRTRIGMEERATAIEPSDNPMYEFRHIDRVSRPAAERLHRNQCVSSVSKQFERHGSW